MSPGLFKHTATWRIKTLTDTAVAIALELYRHRTTVNHLTIRDDI